MDDAAMIWKIPGRILDHVKASVTYLADLGGSHNTRLPARRGLRAENTSEISRGLLWSAAQKNRDAWRTQSFFRALESQIGRTPATDSVAHLDLRRHGTTPRPTSACLCRCASPRILSCCLHPRRGELLRSNLPVVGSINSSSLYFPVARLLRSSGSSIVILSRGNTAMRSVKSYACSAPCTVLTSCPGAVG
jgi:hypothetical protein